MRVSFSTIRNWLAAHSDDLTVEQLTELSSLVEQQRQAATEREGKYRRALEQAAASVGVSVDELLKRSRPGDQGGKQKISGVRRPYLNPYAPEDGLFALFDNRMPDWADKLINHPNPSLRWTKAELHYKEIEAAFERHEGQKWADKYGKSAQAIYVELEQQEPTRYSRQQKRKDA
jgi:hypothetical protein